MAESVIITADDLVAAGACVDGVYQRLNNLHGKIAAAMSASAVLRLADFDDRRYVIRAAKLDGYGDGDGYGFGYGFGDGDGFGDGYGFGYGDGDGYGDGYGGYGDGYGDGDGDGYGGYGDGYGDGDGDGYGEGTAP